jgi:hypothetical protein
VRDIEREKNEVRVGWVGVKQIDKWYEQWRRMREGEKEI